MNGSDKFISIVSYGYDHLDLTLQGSICGKWGTVTLNGGSFTEEDRTRKGCDVQSASNQWWEGGIFQSHELSVLKETLKAMQRNLYMRF